MTNRLQLLAVIATLAALPGCKTFGVFASDENPNVTYADDADTNLKKGDEALENKNFIEAQKYFDYVKSKYPYLDAAKTAELRLADVDFDRDRYLEARDRYQSFIKLHPTHPRLDYAAFRAALTYYKDIPSDFFLLPPSAEKDQANLRGALTAMKEFLRVYPDSTQQAEAKKVLDDVKHRLADHELYVAAFYARRDKWPAVIGRLTVVANEYPGIGLDEKVYFGIYDAWMKLKDEAHAKEALRSLVQKAPNTDGAKKAAALLGSGG